MNFNNAEFLISYGISSQLPESDRCEIAFAGRSNVGKSSLINKLLNRKALARVSAMPGKTATINFYTVDDVHFVDLPGYGYAKVAKTEKYRWSELIEGYFNQDREFTLVVLLIDMRHAPSELDSQMVSYLVEREFPFVIALTKSDKLNKTQLQTQLACFTKMLPYAELLTMFATSAQTGQGMEDLRTVIAQAVEEVQAAQQEEDEMIAQQEYEDAELAAQQQENEKETEKPIE